MSRLPDTLAPWADSLAQLDAALAVDLGPMIHLLEQLVGRLDFNIGESGPMDGYDGTTNRGDPDRLLVSEWLFAEEVPLEFLRRAAESELLYLRQAYQHARKQGRVVAVVDSGPDQLGAGRLVQLAAMVVLDRRAHLAGSELVVADLQSGSTSSGPLSVVLPQWLNARSSRPATPENLSAVLADIPREDQAWVLCGPATAALLSGHRRKIVSRVTTWQATSAAEVGVRVGDSSATLPLPAPGPAVAALRGEGLTRRRTRPESVPVAVAATGQGAVFTSEEPQLLWRGASDGELYTVRVGHGESTRVHLRRLPGTILAAAVLGRRIVAVLTDGERIWVDVTGRRLSRVHEIELPVGEIDLASIDTEEICAAPIRPVFFADNELLVPIKDAWWQIGLEGAHQAQWLGVGPGPALDSPRRIWQAAAGKLYVTSTGGGIEVGNLHRGPILGPDGHLAWSTAYRVWKVRGPDGGVREDIGVGEGEEVIGLTMVNGEPAMVTVSASGRIVRHVTSRHTKTWTAWAGPAHFGIHPTNPWLVRSTSAGVLVGDLQTGQVLLDLKADP